MPIVIVLTFHVSLNYPIVVVFLIMGLFRHS